MTFTTATKHPIAAAAYIASVADDANAEARIHALKVAAEDFYFAQTARGFHSSARFALRAAVVAEKAIS